MGARFRAVRDYAVWAWAFGVAFEWGASASLAQKARGGPLYCTSRVSQGFPPACPMGGSQPLSMFTTNTFVADGEICEFIDFPGDSQEYFMVLVPKGDPNFGAIKVGANLADGVLISRDNFPLPGAVNAAGATGHHDAPAVFNNARYPTGFNIGRVFASYHPKAYDGEGAYFLAMDVSAPAAMDPAGGAQPIAFDVDGDGNRCTQTEVVTPNTVPEAPTVSDDIYVFGVDTDNDGNLDVRVVIGERISLNIPFGSVAIDPGGVVQMLPGKGGTLVPVRRYMLFEDLTGLLALDPATDTPFEQALLFLDSNDDGVVNHLDVGIDSDIELVFRNVRRLPLNSAPECASFTFLADAFNDQALGGGAEDAVRLIAEFPVPDVEVIKEGRCVEGPDMTFRHSVPAVPGSEIEFRVRVQNWGNRDLNVSITDVLSTLPPATAELVPGSCTVVGAHPSGVPADFCDQFEAALAAPGGFTSPLKVGVLMPASECAVALGKQLIFTFRVIIGPEEGDSAFCDDEIDVTNAVSVEATFAELQDPILPPSPFEGTPDVAADGEEEDCPDEACCVGIPNCTPGDGLGDVPDEFNFTVYDESETDDTMREMTGPGDDNVVETEIRCRDIALAKEVRLLPGGPFHTGLDRLDVPSSPADVEFRYTVTNDGEIDEAVVVSDPDLCADVAAVVAALPGEISFVSCVLCTAPNNGNLAVVVVSETTFQTSCIVRFSSEAALRAFTRADDQRAECRALNDDQESDPECHLNCAEVTANVTNLRGVCPDGPIGDTAEATVCHPFCDIQVTKEVRCLNNCQDKDPTGETKPLLQTSQDSCVEFEVTIQNINVADPDATDVPICRVRITDTLADQPGCIEFDGSVRFAVEGQDCGAVPPGFNVNGVPFDWIPADHCRPREGLNPLESLTITFNAKVPVDAAPTCNPVNSVSVDGASDCRPGQMGFTCDDDSSAKVDILEPSLVCLSKEWAYQWDSNGNCEPDAPFTPFASDIDLRDKVFPVRLRLKVEAMNTGDVPLDVIADDEDLRNCVDTLDGVSILEPPDCELGDTKTIFPGATDEWLCDIRVETAEAARALDACDGMTDGVYRNRARVRGRPVSDGTNICVPDELVIEGEEDEEDCAATIRVPKECEIDVTKQVKCADDPDAAYATSVDALPGSRLRYRIQVRNTNTQVKIPRVCIQDTLSCDEWLVPLSVTANIAGHNVLACMGDFDDSLLSGQERCYTFATCRAGAPWIAPNETLTITFDVRVPPDFDETLTSVDCRNDVSVEAYSEVCVRPPLEDVFCAQDTGHAEFNVLIPDIECDKTVRADVNLDGTFDTPATDDLLLPCDTPLPFRLRYQFSITNTGEAPWSNLLMCDPHLVPDAVANGLTVGPCQLCDAGGCNGVNDFCAVLGNLPVGQTATATCDILVPTRTAWEAFAAKDEDQLRDCYSNDSFAKATVDTARICDAEATTHFESPSCSAKVCLAPLCELAVTKRARCLDNCEEKNGIGDAKGTLEAAPGSCVEFEVNITNTSDEFGICRLRISDTLDNQPAHIVFDGSTRFRVGDTDCTVPAGFNVNGTSFEWDPATCGLPSLAPGATLTITFNATVPRGANPDISPRNRITVDAAPTCPPGGPNFCCNDTDTATVDILRPRLTCVSKEWAFQWDSDARADDEGNCAPDEPFSAFSSNIDLRDKVFPVLLRLKLKASNTGQVPLDVVADDPALRSCVLNTPGVAFEALPACELGQTKRIAAGGMADWFCDVSVETAEAMRALDACDGNTDEFYRNTATVSGTLVRHDTNICVPENRVIQGDNPCSASVRVPAPCELDVDKGVKCADEPDSTYAADIDVLPGAHVRYRITVTNIEAFTKIPRVCLRDQLSCCGLLVPGSSAARIGATDVTACLPAGFEASLCTGNPECMTFAACRPAAPWIAPGETLTISFDVRVPSNFEKNDDPDCENDVTVEGYAEACAPKTVPDAFCDTDVAHAEFDVLLPSLECDKQVRADFGNDGTFDTGFGRALNIHCDADFPIRLCYRFTVTNTGETPLRDVHICDPALRGDAAANGLTVTDCPLTGPPGGCGPIPALGVGESRTADCCIVAPSRSHWEAFALKDDGKPRCYVNESRARANVDTLRICDFAADVGVESEPCEASVCLGAECDIEVTKSVRCLDNCSDKNPVGAATDRLEVTPGSCVEFQVDVRNNHPTDPLCRLRISDTLAGQPGSIQFDGHVRFRIGGGATECPVPACFNVNGAPCDWDPQSCALVGLGPSQTLTITFNAIVPANAEPAVSPVNTVAVEGAPTCKAEGPSFCCMDSDTAEVDVLRPDLNCGGKEWAYKWDSNGDCQPDGEFTPFSPLVDLRDKVFPVLLRLRVKAINKGEVPLDVVVNDAALLGCVTSLPDVSFPLGSMCELGSAKLVPAGGMAEWLCDIRVETAEAMRAMDVCDGLADGRYRNTASVSGRLTQGGTSICVPPGFVVPGDGGCSAEIRVPPPCEFDVEKTVTCVDRCPDGVPTGGPVDLLETVPGAVARFTFTVTNTDPLVKIPRVCILDILKCDDWQCPANLRAVLAGHDVSADFAAFRADGQRRCFTFGSRPAAPWIAPGETLTISFEVQVPADYSLMGENPDCHNTVTVDGFTEVCGPSECDDCVFDRDSAGVDVKIPKLECRKTVSADFGDDGSVEISGVSNANLNNPTFPVALTYSLRVRNAGEITLTDVSICDDRLVQDALAAGLTVRNCGLCDDPVCDGVNDRCRMFGDIPPGDIRVASCTLVVADEPQWMAFAGRDVADNRQDCYTNRASGFADAEPTCAPLDFEGVDSPPCEATVCMSILRRCPVTKATFDVWNENERRYSGTERCIISWDETLLSRYGLGGRPNHFLREVLGTNKGKARIDGVASPTVCGTGTISAPLLGVAAKILNFGRRGVDYAGVTLIGTGTEIGTILYEPIPGGAAARDSSQAPTSPKEPVEAEIIEQYGDRTLFLDGFARAGNTLKGSLLVFPKVEVKWDAEGDVIQDTFLTLVNDGAGDVWVQLYFVNGDQPAEALLMGDQLFERAHLGCNAVDNTVLLTANQPGYWSALSGEPLGMSPWTILDPGDPPGRPDLDPRNPQGRVLRGYVVAWAVNTDGQEIRWNHLTGEALIVSYKDSAAWDYRPWAFQAVAGASNGSLLNLPYGRLDLDKMEFEAPPSRLHFEFFATGTRFSTGSGYEAIVDTDLTLWVSVKDLRSP